MAHGISRRDTASSTQHLKKVVAISIVAAYYKSSVSSFTPAPVLKTFGSFSKTLSFCSQEWPECQLSSHTCSTRISSSLDANNVSEQVGSLTTAASEMKTRLSKEDERLFLNKFRDYTRAKSHLYNNLESEHDFKELDQILQEGPKIREALIEHNMGLVYFVVSKYFNSKTQRGRGKYINSLSYDDLIQEGAIGLAIAIDKFDIEIAEKANSNFGTYAIYWIKSKVLRAIAAQDDLIRVPEHVSYSISKIQAASLRLGLDLDFNDMTEAGRLSLAGSWRDPHREHALALEAGLSVSQVREALRVASRRSLGGYISFEPWMQSKQPVSTQSISDGNSVYQDIMRNELKDDLAQFLNPKELQAISLRYGLTPTVNGQAVTRDYEAEAERDLFGGADTSTNTYQSKQTKRNGLNQGRWGEAMSFQEVGRRMAVSAEYGRQLCSAALKKLKRAAEEGDLRPEYLSI